jgi:hypothetical protein
LTANFSSTQGWVELEVRLRLIAEEPSSDLLGDGTWRLVKRLFREL